MGQQLGLSAVAHGVPFAISEPVYTAAGLVPNCEKKITVRSPGREMPIAVCLSTSAAALVPAPLIALRSPMPKFLRKPRA